MLELKNLSVSVGENPVLREISMNFQKGNIYYIVGKNGGGKSSLLLSIMGYPKYKQTSGDIVLSRISLKDTSITERAQSGIFLALQNIPEIPGIRLGEFLRTIYNEKIKRTSPETKILTPFVFRKFITKKAQKYGISESFLDRDLNVGFSGGEKRRIEMLQIDILEPDCILIDEIDSGLDIDAFRSIANSLSELATPEKIIIVVTHNFKLAEYLPPNEVLVVEGGKIVRSGGVEVLGEVMEMGFEREIPHQPQ